VLSTVAGDLRELGKTLQMLDEVGKRFSSRTALGILAGHCAMVDNDTHRPEPLADDVLTGLDRILAVAEREVDKSGQEA
jgi:hypothetical protein